MSIWLKTTVTATTVLAVAVTSGTLQPTPDFSGIGEANGWSCSNIFITCSSQLKKELKDNSYNNEDLVRKLLKDSNWEQPSPLLPRVPKEPGIQPMFQIRSIKKADKIALKKMPDGGYVLARITADRSGSEDARYGIGRRTSNAAGVTSNEFFIVANKFDINDKREFEKGLKVATWEIWGIAGNDGERRLVKIGEQTGDVRYCGPAHQTSYKERSAKFLRCSTIGALHALRADASFSARLLGMRETEFSSLKADDRRVSIDRMIEAIRATAGGPQLKAFSSSEQARIASLRDEINDPTNPAWMACGVGCCTADIVPF